MSAVRPKSMTHAEFYRACECLKKNKAAFIDGRPTLVEAAAMLSKLLGGVEVSASTMAILKETSGISWRCKVGRGSSTEHSARKHAIETLTRAVWALYQKLGETPSDPLKCLWEKVNQIGEEAE